LEIVNNSIEHIATAIFDKYDNRDNSDVDEEVKDEEEIEESIEELDVSLRSTSDDVYMEQPKEDVLEVKVVDDEGKVDEDDSSLVEQVTTALLTRLLDEERNTRYLKYADVDSKSGNMSDEIEEKAPTVSESEFKQPESDDKVKGGEDCDQESDESIRTSNDQHEIEVTSNDIKYEQVKSLIPVPPTSPVPSKYESIEVKELIPVPPSSPVPLTYVPVPPVPPVPSSSSLSSLANIPSLSLGGLKRGPDIDTDDLDDLYAFDTPGRDKESKKDSGNISPTDSSAKEKGPGTTPIRDWMPQLMVRNLI
jgi:hypothetical protein